MKTFNNRNKVKITMIITLYDKYSPRLTEVSIMVTNVISTDFPQLVVLSAIKMSVCSSEHHLCPLYSQFV